MAKTASGSRTAAARGSAVLVAGFGAILGAILLPRIVQSPATPRGPMLLVQAVIFLTFLIAVLPAAKITFRAGCRFAVALGLAAMGAGSLLLLPVESSVFRMQVPGGLVVMTCGAALVHVAANLQVSSCELASGFFVAGAAAGPWICAFVALQEAAGDAAPSPKAPYAVAAAGFGVLALVASRIRWEPPAAAERRDHSRGKVPPVRHPMVEAAAVFSSVGGEMAIASSLAGFCMQPEIGGWGTRIAAGFVVLYLAAVVAGRVAGAALLRTVSAARLVGCLAVASCLLVTASIGFSGSPAMWSLVLGGTVVSMAFPGIFVLHARAPSRTATSGLLLPALAGGFAVPVSQYLLAERIGLHAAVVIPAICCLYLMYYGFATPEPRVRRARRDERRSPVCSIDSQKRYF